MSLVLLSFLIFYIFVEAIFFITIKLCYSKIPWIITEKDEFPKFEKTKINNFLKNTFDINLGWNWKPNSKYSEKSFDKSNQIFYGKFGERLGSKKNIIKKKYHFASFGDSFVFCRYVNSKQTWQENLSNLTLRQGLNLGVGNFGLDQIYLKYLNAKIPKNIKTIFIGFVPETLSRCLCSWKHYHEFNNIFGFKPRFVYHRNNLKLIPNPIKKQKDFENIYKIIKKLRKHEFFYKVKFSRSKLFFPYFLSLFKRPNYNFKLILFSILKILNINENKIYELIIKENCIKNDFYFGLKKNNQLIKKIMTKIADKSKKRNQKVIFLIFPQKYDLKLKKNNYKKFFAQNKKNFNILDFTNVFKKNELSKVYLQDKYGGHLSPYGNKLVAKTILKKGYI